MKKIIDFLKSNPLLTGVIKQDFGFTRFHRKGMKNVKVEFLLVCLGYNLKKFHISRIRQSHINPSGQMS